MAEFKTFSVGDVYQQAEAIKAARRQADTDKLRDQYLGVNIKNAQNQETRAQEDQQSQKDAHNARMKFLQTSAILNSPDPVSAVKQYAPEMETEWNAAHGAGSFAQLPPEQLTQFLRQAVPNLAAKAGIEPVAPKTPEAFTLSPGQTRFGPDGKPLANVAPTPDKPSSNARFRAMNPQEIATYGLPPGSAAQINDTTGQIQVLNKPSVAPAQSAAERKAMMDARVKLPRVEAAVRRADRLANAIAVVAKNSVFDGGPLDAKALSLTKEGREVIAASAQLMPELSALTRVPGIGSQSDLEARLASLALPSNEFEPEANQRSMAELYTFIQDLKEAYQSIAAGGVSQAPEEAGPVSQQMPDNAPQIVNFADLPN